MGGAGVHTIPEMVLLTPPPLSNFAPLLYLSLHSSFHDIDRIQNSIQISCISRLYFLSFLIYFVNYLLDTNIVVTTQSPNYQISLTLARFFFWGGEGIFLVSDKVLFYTDYNPGINIRRLFKKLNHLLHVSTL